MHFVEHDVTDEVETSGILVDQVAQDLGSHHDDRRVVVDRVLARHQADQRLAVGTDEVVVLLIAQGFERRRVQDLRAFPQRTKDRVLSHDRLPARGGGADEHPAAAADELLDGLALKRIEAEGQSRFELGDQGARGLLADGVHNWISSVETSVIRAPSLCDSMNDSAAARTLSAWRPSALTVAIASSASCHRSSSPTSAAVTLSSWRSRRSRPLTTWRLDLSDPESGRCSTTRATLIATLEAITICF